MKELPVGTAYAVWTGVGAVGTAILGIYLFGDSASAARLVCLAMIAGESSVSRLCLEARVPCPAPWSSRGLGVLDQFFLRQCREGIGRGAPFIECQGVLGVVAIELKQRLPCIALALDGRFIFAV